MATEKRSTAKKGDKPGNLLPLYVIDVLKKYSSEKHMLTQAFIREKLSNEYALSVSDKTISRLMHALGYLDPKLQLNVKFDSMPDSEIKETDRDVFTKIFLQRELDDTQLHMLIDSVRFSRKISLGAGNKLLAGLKKLASPDLRENINTSMLLADKNVNDELLKNIELLNKAIKDNQKVQFNYAKVSAQGEETYSTDKNGSPLLHKFNPFEIVMANGNSYIIGNHEDYDKLSHYRIGKIRNLQLLEEKRKPCREIKGMGNDFSVQDYVSKHPLMCFGECVVATFIFDQEVESYVRETFGEKLNIKERQDGKVRASVEVGFTDMRIWARQYALNVEVVAPQNLVDALREDVRQIAQKYGV